MGGEVDDSWIEYAVERYQRIESLHAEFERALTKVDVTVRSPDGLVEIVVGGDGVIRDVAIGESARGRSTTDLSHAVLAAIVAAADAAQWARHTLRQDAFAGYESELGTGPGPSHQHRSRP